MTADLIFMGALAALACFIIWESWQRHKSNAKPLARASVDKGYFPGAKQAESSLFILAGVMAVLGAAEAFATPSATLTGRSAAIIAMLTEWFGSWGTAVFCWLCALFFFCFGHSQRRKRLQQPM